MPLISKLPSPYRELAEKRKRERHCSILNSDLLSLAFDWTETPEGQVFWQNVNNGGNPPIPHKVEITWDLSKEKAKQYDTTNPDHYKQSKETFEEMIDIWGKDAFIKHCEMCAFKYMRRLGKKPTASVQEDIDKANWYLNKANELKNK